jgi:erythromycin esterase-like protein
MNLDSAVEADWPDAYRVNWYVRMRRPTRMSDPAAARTFDPARPWAFSRGC